MQITIYLDKNMNRLIFTILLIFGLFGQLLAQMYQEGFETSSTFSLSGFLSPEESPFPQFTTLNYLGYGCWCSSTGGVGVSSGAGVDGSQGVQTSPNTAGNDLISPRFEMIADEEYTVSFQYNKQNVQAATIDIEIDAPDGIEGNFELLESITIAGSSDNWRTFELEYEAEESGTARFRFVFSNSAEGQRIFFDNLKIDPVAFSDSPCNPTLPPEMRFVIPENTQIPEDTPSSVELSVYRLGFINQNSTINLAYSGGSANPTVDFEWLQVLPYSLTFTPNLNEQRVEILRTIADGLDEMPETVILQLETVNNALTQTDNVLTLSIVDEGVIIAPVAIPDVYVAFEDNLLSVIAPGVLGNDQGQNLSATLAQSPLQGNLTLANDGSFEYQPSADFFGVDVFEYTLGSEVPPARVQINVLEVNDAPVFLNFTESLVLLQTDPTRTLTFQIGTGASNEASQVLSLEIEAENEEILNDWNWNLENDQEVTLTITPDPEKSGEVQFICSLRDSGGTQNGGINQSTAILTLNIEEFVPPLPNQILLPNTFTPNNDNQNDRFILRSNNVATVDFTIFDKWGKRVFQTNSVEEATQIGWTGENQPNGMYAWTVRVQFLNGEIQQAQGKVYLVK